MKSTPTHRSAFKDATDRSHLAGPSAFSLSNSTGLCRWALATTLEDAKKEAFRYASDTRHDTNLLNDRLEIIYSISFLQTLWHA